MTALCCNTNRTLNWVGVEIVKKLRATVFNAMRPSCSKVSLGCNLQVSAGRLGAAIFIPR